MNQDLIKSIITRYELNMDYKIIGMSIEDQTNYLIQSIINDLYEKIDTSKIIVYIYNDDLISLIGYNILKTIQMIKPFKLRIFGKIKKTKKMIKAKEKFISKRKINKILSKNFIISSFNPIYKVKNLNHISKKIFCLYNYQLMDKFTPEELKMAQEFYHIGYIKDYQKIDGKKINVLDIKELDKLQENFNNIKDFYKWGKNEFDGPAPKCMMLWIEEDSAQECLQKAEQFDGIVLYFYSDKEELAILNSPSYNVSVKWKVNRIDKGNNCLNYELGEDIYLYYSSNEALESITFEGNWPEEEKRKITDLAHFMKLASEWQIAGVDNIIIK